MSTVRNFLLKKSFLNDSCPAGQPTFSTGGKRLCFIYDMPGGKGMTGIYRVPINAGDSPGTPENPGDRITNETREMFPFADTEGNLFYSPCGQVDLGGRAVFHAASERKNNIRKSESTIIAL